MSRAPYSLPKAEQPFSFGNQTAWDTTLGWRYPNPRMQELYGTESMGETAENISQMMPEITREQQDAFALASHQRAIAAIDSGKFAEEIVPVSIPQRKGDPVVVSVDERPRRDTTLENLARLRPTFRKDGTVTAGNSSGLNDGAAAVLLMSAEKATELGLKPLAWIFIRCRGCTPASWVWDRSVPYAKRLSERGSAYRISAWSSSTKPSLSNPWRSLRSLICRLNSPTSMVAQLRWVIRLGVQAPASSPRFSTRCAAVHLQKSTPIMVSLLCVWASVRVKLPSSSGSVKERDYLQSLVYKITSWYL